MDELEAIELGKIWMRNSINIGHDYEHAQNVEKLAFKVFTALKKDKKVDLTGIDRNIISLAAWWHDCYKARLKGMSLWTYFFEGYESEKIMRKELGDYLSSNRMEMLAKAIRMHNHFNLHFIITKDYPPLLQILLEADNIEAMSEARAKRSFSKMNKKLLAFGYKIFLWNLVFWAKRLPKSTFMSDYLSKLSV